MRRRNFLIDNKLRVRCIEMHVEQQGIWQDHLLQYEIHSDGKNSSYPKFGMRRRNFLIDNKLLYVNLARYEILIFLSKIWIIFYHLLQLSKVWMNLCRIHNSDGQNSSYPNFG